MSSTDTKNFTDWVRQAVNYELPRWEALPSIPLYMDQIMMFTGEALEIFEPGEKPTLLTSSMINNYVKNGLVAHPVHKKYGKEHLSKLIMTSMLKQVLSIQDIGVLFSGDEEAKALYEAFTSAQDQTLHETAAVIDPEADAAKLRAAALQLAAEANARRAVAQRILSELAKTENDSANNKKSSKK